MLDYSVSYRKKDGSIQCIISYKDGGKWKTRSKQGFKAQKDSKSWQKKTLEELESKVKLNAIIEDEFRDITLKEFKKIYLSDIETTKSYNTYLTYCTALNKFSDLDDEALNSLKYVDIKDVALRLVKDGLLANTVRGYISIFRTMLKVAMDEYEIISSNPLLGKSVVDKEKKDRTKINALTKAESDDLLSKMALDPDYIIVLVALHSGMRIGEIAGLCEDAIYFKDYYIDVNKQWKKLKNEPYGFGKLKSDNSYRHIPLTPLLHKELQRYIRNSPRELFHGRLFPENTNTLSERLRRRFERLGYDISMHDLRHTYATRLLSNGVDVKTVAEFLGDTVQTVIETYIHFTSDMFESGKEMVQNIF